MGQRVDPIEALADYLKALARSGRCCTSNNRSIASVLGVSVETARGAKRALVRAKRLVGAWQIWESIDGVRFGVIVDSEVEQIKTILRRKFGPVYDARTLAKPDFVATGKPQAVIIDGRIVSWDDAVKLALAVADDERLKFKMPLAGAAVSGGEQVDADGRAEYTDVRRAHHAPANEKLLARKKS